MYPDGTTTLRKYDAEGRLIEQIDEEGNVTTTAYDAAGRAQTVTDESGAVTTFMLNEANELLEKIDALGHSTRYTVDGLGRTLSMISAEGISTLYSYDSAGNKITSTDGQGRIERFQYDRDNRLTLHTLEDKTTIGYGYDAEGNRTSVTSPNKETRIYTYDALNRVIAETDPAGEVIRMSYDSVGRLAKKTDRNGESISYDYDAGGKVIKEEWFNSAGALESVITTTYDKANQIVEQKGPLYTYLYSYDTRGRKIQVQATSATPELLSYVHTFSYDDRGNLTAITDEAGMVVNSQYDVKDQLKSRSMSNSQGRSLSVEFFYNDRGERTRQIYRNTSSDLLVQTRSYDTDGRLTQHSYLSPVSGFSDERNYSWDAADEITAIGKQGALNRYSHDSTGQLTRWQSPQGTTLYSYDEQGNRIGEGARYGEDNRLLENTKYTYRYDEEGSLIERVKKSDGAKMILFYDQRKRLVTVKKYAGDSNLTDTIEYVYDLQNRRVAKKINGTLALQSIYNGDSVWRDGNGTYYLHSNTIDEILATTDANVDKAIRLYVLDHLGTVDSMLDVQGLPQYQCGYTPFGKIIQRSGLDTRFGFTGREYDEETGFYYYRARYYDPEVGRFISQDPIGLDGRDVNFYRYAGNSSILTRDPSGTVVQTSHISVHKVLAVGFLAGISTAVITYTHSDSYVNQIGEVIDGTFTIVSSAGGSQHAFTKTMIAAQWGVILGSIAKSNQPQSSEIDYHRFDELTPSNSDDYVPSPVPVPLPFNPWRDVQRKQTCKGRHPDWPICPRPMHHDPRTAIRDQSVQVSGWKIVVGEARVTKSTSPYCPGGLWYQFERSYVADSQFEGEPLVSYRCDGSVTCCPCCDKVLGEARSCTLRHPYECSGGDPTNKNRIPSPR